MREFPRDIVFTPAVKAVQERKGSRVSDARMERGRGWQTTVTPDLAAFLIPGLTGGLQTESPRDQPRERQERAGTSAHAPSHGPRLRRTKHWSGQPTAQAFWQSLALCLGAAAHRGRSPLRFAPGKNAAVSGDCLSPSLRSGEESGSQDGLALRAAAYRRIRLLKAVRAAPENGPEFPVHHCHRHQIGGTV